MSPPARVPSRAEVYGLIGYSWDLSSQHRVAVGVGGAFFPLTLGPVHLGTRVELRGEWTERTFEGVGATTQYAFSVFTGGGVEWRAARWALILADLGVRVGYGEVRGDGVDALTLGGSIQGVWSGPSARLGFALRPLNGRSATLGVMFEGTYVVREVVGMVESTAGAAGCQENCARVGWYGWTFGLHLTLGWSR